MRKILSLFLAFVFVVGICASAPVTANAASVGDLTFELNEDGESYYVADCSEDASGEIVIPSTYNGLPVTSIGASAFGWCDSITSITIPGSVTSIEYWAFSSSDSLTSVTIPDSVTSIGFAAFEACSSLKSITIPDSVTSIGDSTFYDCSSLTSITIGNSVMSIGVSAFEECSSLTSITIPDGVTSIGGYAFYNCTSLTSVTIGDSVTSIDRYAFYDCTSLTSITIPDSVTSIGEDAFYNTGYYNDNSNWENNVLYIGKHLIEAKKEIPGAYTIKSGTKTIAGYAFYDCTSLTSVTIPDGVTSIGNWAFEYCTSLTSITIPDSVTSIGVSAFCGCTSLTSITIPNSVTNIGWHAFEDCTSLTSITIPDSVTSIGYRTFYNCTSLTSVTIPDSVTDIGSSAFYGCTSLTSVTIPASVIYIEGVAFGYAYDSGNEKDYKVEGFTIYGTTGSAAETYAKENGFDFISGTPTQIKLATPTVKVANTAKGIKVTWNKIANAQKYVVYQRTYNANTKKWSNWKALKSTTGLSYVDTTTKLGTIYRYTVKAVNGSNVSGFKSTSNIKFDVKPTVTVANASNGIKVSWSTVANATGYTVYSSTYNSKTKKWSGWKNRGTTKANAKSWVDKSAKAGTVYKYTVRARYGSAASSFVASASLVRLLNPTVKVAKASNGVKVTWNKIAGAKNYKIYRATYANGKWSGWSGIATTNNKTFAYVDKTAKKGVYYKYTVRAVNGKSASAFTASKNVKR